MGERRLTIPGRYDRLAAICEFVERSAAEAGLDETAQFHCQIAVDEACANIIEHAYEGEARGSIEIECRSAPGELTITLRDHGKGFDPTRVPAPKRPATLDETAVGGLGLYIMRQVMDEVDYASDESGNTLVLVKRGAKPSTT